MARRISLSPCATGLKKWPWRVNLPAGYTTTGKRQRHFFKTRQEAETFAQSQRIRLDNWGRASSALTPSQAEQAAVAFHKLSPYHVSLNTVVVDFIARHDARARSVTFKTLFERFVESKKNRSEAYLRGLKYTFPRFSGLHDRKVCDLSPTIVDRETDGMPAGARNAFLCNLRAVFNFGIKRGWLEQNPISKLDFSPIRRGEVVTLTPDETEALIRSAEGMIPLFSLRKLKPVCRDPAE